MKPERSIGMNWVGPCALAALAITMSLLNAQAPAYVQAGRGGGGRGGAAPALFTALDTDKDGSLTRSEMKSGFDSWFTSWDSAKAGSLGQDQLVAGLSVVFPAPPPQAAGVGGVFNPAGNSQPLTAKQADIDAMMAALPATAGVKPLRPRKILVVAHTGAGGFVHSSIPLAAKTVEALGNQGGLWSTTISYDAADINAANLKQYDAIFLDSTTGCFLDDADPAVTAARRAAFLEFVRGGKGVAAIHAATDSYHTDCVAASTTAATAGRGPARGGTANMLATQFLAQGDKNNDRKVTREELAALADNWFDKLDTEKSGKISRADFVARFNSAVMPPPSMPAGGRGPGAEAAPVLQWSDFNKLIGGYFKFHWSDPQLITVKIDDPKSPLTEMFRGQEFEIHDETYTFAQDSFSRANVHVLTSIDYDKMSAADKAKERDPRTDGDYALSYIRREGRGRVFYEGHGHSERIYAMTPMLEHVRAGIQYSLGDLKANDSPSKQ
jgi:Trehalose utilisation/EF hand/EF-hand domain pair